MKNNLTNFIYIIDGEDVCFSSEKYIKEYFHRLWNIHRSMTHTGEVFLSEKHTSTHNLSIFVYRCSGYEDIFTRRTIVKTKEQLDRCFELVDTGYKKIRKKEVIMRASVNYPHEDTALTLKTEYI